MSEVTMSMANKVFSLFSPTLCKIYLFIIGLINLCEKMDMDEENNLLFKGPTLDLNKV